MVVRWIGVLALGCGGGRAPCRSLAGQPADRVHACLDQLRAPPISAGAREVLDDLQERKVLALGAADPGYPVLGVGDVDGLEALLFGADEAAVASRLRDEDVRGVVVSRALVGALDRDGTVYSRLAQHDFLEWFQLRYVTEELFVYTVRGSSVRLSIDTGDALLLGLRARLAGTDAPKQGWDPDTARLIGSIRLQGRTLAQRHAVADGDGALEEALDDLADKLVREWERKVEPTGVGRLRDRLPDARLEIHVVMEKAPVEPRSREAIADLWEMGVDGMVFRQREPRPGEELDEKFTFLPGSELVARALHTPDEFLRVAVDEFGWNDARPWEEDPRTRLDLIRDQHFMEASLGGGPAVRLVRGVPEVPMAWVTDEHVQDMLVAGGEWWLANQLEGGKFEYKYWPEQNRRSEDYNEVRHLLGVRDLADTWRFRHDPRYLEGSRRAMDFLLAYAVEGEAKGPLPSPPPGTMLFRYPNGPKANQKTGTVAVALLGWVAWAQATGSHDEDARIRAMAKFLLAMQEESGKFDPYHVQAGHPYESSVNDITPGEAMLALGEVAEYFGEREWIAPYSKFAAYYQPWFRERAVRKIPTGRWPHGTYDPNDRLELVQFGPWSVMAAAQVYALNQDPVARDFGLEVGDWMVDNYQWSEARAPWPDYVGGYYKNDAEIPAMQTFCYSEGTAAAYALALASGDARAEKFARATAESIRFLEVMQYDDLDSYPFARPDKIRGGVKYTMNEAKVRTDYVGHGLSTLVQWLDARAKDPKVQQALHDPQDLQRPAGTRGSVPGLVYATTPLAPPSGEVAARPAERPIYHPGVTPAGESEEADDDAE